MGRSESERRARPAHLLGVCTGAETVHSEHLVAWLEGGYVAADRLDLTGRDHADDPLPRRPDAERRSQEEPVDAAQLEASHDAVAGCDRGREEPDAHFLVPGTRVGTVLIWSTSGGPYAVQTAALISSPQPAAQARS